MGRGGTLGAANALQTLLDPAHFTLNKTIRAT
jgi:hypothetical protein